MPPPYRWSPDGSPDVSSDARSDQPGRATTARRPRRPSSRSSASGIDREARPRRRAPRARGSPAPTGRRPGGPGRGPRSSRSGEPSGVALRDDPEEAAPARALRDRLEQDRAVDRSQEAVRRAGPRAPGSPAGRTARTSRSSRPGCRAGRTGASVPPSGALRGPERERLAGLDRDPPERRSGRSSRRRASTTSYGPTDTPPETTIASAPPASAAHSRDSTSSSRSFAIPSACGSRAGVVDERREARAVRVGDPGRTQVLTGGDGPRRRSRGPRRAAGGGPCSCGTPAPAARATACRRQRPAGARGS